MFIVMVFLLLTPTNSSIGYILSSIQSNKYVHLWMNELLYEDKWSEHKREYIIKRNDEKIGKKEEKQRKFFLKTSLFGKKVPSLSDSSFFLLLFLCRFSPITCSNQDRR